MNLPELIKDINTRPYTIIDSVMNTIVQSKTISAGLVLAIYKEDLISYCLVYDKTNLKYSEYDIVCAKKTKEIWELVIATDEQRTKILKSIKSKI